MVNRVEKQMYLFLAVFCRVVKVVNQGGKPFRSLVSGIKGYTTPIGGFNPLPHLSQAAWYLIVFISGHYTVLFLN